MDNYSEQSPYAVVFEKIRAYRKNSIDISFHEFLDKEAGIAARGEKTPEKLVFELDWAYAKYKEVEAKRCEDATSSATAVNEKANNTFGAKNIASVTEFTLGTIVLSILGGIFLLIALISFGKYYLDEYFQSIILYAAGIITVVLSETLVEKRLPKFAHVLTAIGFGLLIYTTFFSTFSMGFFNEYVALGIIFVISAALLFLAKLRKSLTLEIICSLGTHALLLFFAFSSVDEISLIMIFIINFVINLVLFIAGKDTANKASAIVRAITVTISSVILLNMSADINVLAGIGVGYVFLLLAAMFFCEDNKPAKWILTCGAAVVTFVISFSEYNNGYALIISKAGLLVVCTLFFIAKFKSKEKWIAYYLFIAALFGSFVDISNVMATLLVYICILVLTKYLATIADIHECDAVVTTIVLAAAAINYDLPISYIAPVIAFTCLFFTRRWKIYQEFITLAFTAIIIGENVPSSFTSLSLVAVSVILPIALAYLDKERPNYFEAFVISALAFAGICITYIPFNDFSSVWTQRIVVLSSFVIALAGLIFLLNGHTNLEWKGKYIVIAALATYLSFFLGLENIWMSVSLMSVALIVIAIGSFVNYKPVRLCGLCLSLLVLGKVAIFDSTDMSDEKRIIVFFVVGLLAIAIAFAYMLLEKKQNKTKIESVEETPNPYINMDLPNKDFDSKENANEETQ